MSAIASPRVAVCMPLTVLCSNQAKPKYPEPKTPSRVNNASAGQSSDSQSPILPLHCCLLRTPGETQSRCPSNQ